MIVEDGMAKTHRSIHQALASNLDHDVNIQYKGWLLLQSLALISRSN